MLFAGLLIVALGLVGWCQRQESPARWRVRLWYYPVAMNLAYLGLATAVPMFHPALEDARLARWDAWLTGGSPAALFAPFARPALSELASLSYLFFFPYLYFGWIYYTLRPLAQMQSYFTGLFTVYGLGFIGYTLLPAAGLYLNPAALARLAPLPGGPLTALNARLVFEGSNHVDCFPSLHCAITCYILFFDRRLCPWRFRVFLLPVVALWISTVYLRFHYWVDLPAAFALATFGLWVARNYPKDPAPLAAEEKLVVA
jgi:hypothetical protein